MNNCLHHITLLAMKRCFYTTQNSKWPVPYYVQNLIYQALQKQKSTGANKQQVQACRSQRAIPQLAGNILCLFLHLPAYKGIKSSAFSTLFPIPHAIRREQKSKHICNTVTYPLFADYHQILPCCVHNAPGLYSYVHARKGGERI